MERIVIIRFFLIPVLFCLGFTGMRGQVVQEFSNDSSNFTADLREFMSNALNEHQNFILEKFIAEWDSGHIDEVRKQQILRISNKLLKRRAKPEPHFVIWIDVVMAFNRDYSGGNCFMEWMKELDRSLNSGNSLKPVTNLLTNTRDILRNNVLHRSPTTIWKSDQPFDRFEFKDSLRIYFDRVLLTCISVRDSMHIRNAGGYYVPSSGLWHGNSGLVTWERSGYDRTQVYATLSEYRINMISSGYQADSVIFVNRIYFDFDMTGSMEDRVVPGLSGTDVNFPVFTSYQKNYEVDNLYPHVYYRGGLAMRGTRLAGFGTRQNCAELLFYMKDSLRLKAGARFFSFEPEKAVGRNTSVMIPLESDSIYHPDLALSYFPGQNEVSLTRTGDYSSQAPFYNTYHRVEMNFERISWKLDENIILFTSAIGSAIGFANFESYNLFDAQKYARLQGIDSVNPLVTLRKFSEKVFDVSFKGKEYARYIRTSHHQVQQMLKRLAREGFILYDLETDMATVRQKMYDYIYASVGYIDYDVINLASEVGSSRENARLDLSNLDITIFGVSDIRLSNAQYVVIYPEEETLVLKRNRNFQFNGMIDAGLFTFYGNNFFFDYEGFRLNLQDIDSLSIKAKSEELDSYGRALLVNVRNIIQDMTGELLIDDPENKSGLKDLPRYPEFISKENSFVYYDDPGIQNGVYKKDKFYFEIYPFSFDSLDNFSKRGLQLKGEFVSAGIIPDMEQTLVLQEDNSLGFKYMVPPEGVPVYSERGRFYDYIEMSNRGLKGRGKLEYLASNSETEDCTFHPDSLFAETRSFRIKKTETGRQFPFVASSNNSIIWYPYEDQLLTSQGEKPFTVFNDSSFLEGELVLSSAGLTGSGTLDLINSVFESDLFSFRADQFDSDTADFKLKSLYTDGYALITDNINAHVDFDSGSGSFNTNQDFTLVEFPENKYISHIRFFRWNMEKKELSMGIETEEEPDISPSGEDAPYAGAEFISIDPAQDSLRFVSPLAIYNYRDNVIDASGVRHIRVADAFVYPKDGKVFVDKNAVMGEMTGSQITADTLNRTLNFCNATVNIRGRNAYQGSGDHDYIDETGAKQTIHFDLIKPDDDLSTYAEGIIPETKEFTLSPFYDYQGKVFAFAGQQFFTFHGAVRLKHQCESLNHRWFYFESMIDPEEIFIPVSGEPRDINMEYIRAGLYITADSSHIYPAFFSRKRLASDRAIINAGGFLYYDKETGEYKISSREKIMDENQTGNLLVLERKPCVITGEGNISLGLRLGQVRMRTVGNIRYDIPEDHSELETMIALDFFISEEALDLMAGELDSLPGLEGFDLSDQAYQKGMAELVGKENAEKLNAELSLYGTYSATPPELVHTLFLNKVKLRWNTETSSYRNYGKIGVGSIGTVQINKMADGYVELTKKRAGDQLDIYLKPDGRHWYYFGYTRGVMQTSSSNRMYNGIIAGIKTRKRKLKTSRREVPYVYVVATQRKRQLFLRRFTEEMETETEPEP